jgi:hypothetical protein
MSDNGARHESHRKPAAMLIHQNGTRWMIQLREFAEYRSALGADVMNAFCRCFIHADRLKSMVSFAHVSEQYHGRESVAFGRDLHVMVWFTIGTLRELARAINDCRNALAKRRMLDPKSDPWIRLREVEDRWERDELFRKMRDRAAFHVDGDVVEAGIAALQKDHRDVILCQGDGRKEVNSSLTLGLETQINGLGMDLAAYGKFVETVSDDHAIGSAIQEAFILATRAAGVSFGGE